MADLHLSFAMTPYDRVLPLITGEVKPAGITLEYQGMPGAVPGVFYDQIKYQRYDLSEMSFSSSLVERAKGWPYRLRVLGAPSGDARLWQEPSTGANNSWGRRLCADSTLGKFLRSFSRLSGF